MDFLKLQAEWKPPAELVRSMPREVRLTGTGTFLTVVMVVLICAAGTLCLFLENAAARDAKRRQILGEQGIDGEATISRLWRDAGKDHTPMVAYHFTHEGRGYSGKSSAPSRTWRTLAVGAPLPVRFLPSNPSVNQPRAWEPDVLPAWLGLLVGGMMLLGPIIIGCALSAEKRLLAEGQAVPGVVTRYSNAGHGQKRVQYEFAIRKGSTPLKGRGCPTRRLPSIGDVICVLYDPENPKRNTAYPTNLHRVG